MRKLLVPIAGLTLLSACSALSAVEATDDIQINSDPPGALAYTSLGQRCTTPCNVTVLGKDSFMVYFVKPGYQMAEVPVSTISPEDKSGVAGRMLHDLVASGADDHAPNPVYARLVAMPLDAH